MRRYEQVSGALFTLIAPGTIDPISPRLASTGRQLFNSDLVLDSCLPSYWQSGYLGFSSLERHRLTSA